MMAAGSISKSQFVEFVAKIATLSIYIHDFWEKKEIPGKATYLTKKEVRQMKEIKSPKQDEDLVEDDEDCLLENNVTECLSYEYHVIYSPSYSVPVLYFNVFHQNGKLLSLEEVWSIVPEHYKDRLEKERWSFITQQEHPLLGRPFYMLHPCHTTDLMKQVSAVGNDQNSNYIISWLSAVGPVVGLELSPVYGQVQENNDNESVSTNTKSTELTMSEIG